jgi:hypothetical protein
MVRRRLAPGKHQDMAFIRHVRGEARYTRLVQLDISLS